MFVPEYENGRRVSITSLAFHELAEAYAKIDEGKPYWDRDFDVAPNGTTMVVGLTRPGAHQEAVQREDKLRGQSQNPSIRDSGRAGGNLTNQVIRDPHN
jgi:hypothetical protein